MTAVHTRKPHHEITQDLAATAMGRQPADLIIRNGTLVNVNTAQLQPNVDVVVRHGWIALVGDASDVLADENTQVVDAAGRYLVPGFIDSHMHVESAMVDLPSFAAGVLPQGTTTICPDIHEVTNVLGLRAVELFHNIAEELPLKVLLAMPVCVPSIPGFEDAGATISAADVAEAYQKGWVQLQGEQMNFPGVIYGDPNVHAITAQGLKAGFVLTGHYANLDLNQGLNAFIASGLTACHEGTTAEGTLRRAQLGMYAQQRYGTAWLDLPNLIPAILDNPEIDTRMFTMVTDDVSSATIHEAGHLIRVVRKAISLGLPPMLAIQMVTINPAQMLEKARWIGSISPGRAADILLVSDLEALTIDQVYTDGDLVAEGGQLKINIPAFDYPAWAVKSIHLPTLTAQDFAIPVENNPVRVRVMRVFPGMVHTEEEIVEMRAHNGRLSADLTRDILKAALFYRHDQNPAVTSTKGLGFVTGTQFNPGCAYASTVSHDCHNLMVIGSDDQAMALAANTLIEAGGGICIVVNGSVETVMPLPLAGIMSLEPIAVAAQQVAEVERALKMAGCPHEAFEMTLSLLGLIVIEELHLSNRGLVALKPGQPPQIVDLIVTP
ncbi:MAG: adenine deaminase [Brevefilum sp.]